jgi:ribosome modulation factor
MAFTRNTRKALRTARAAKSKCGYVTILKEGEKAAMQGKARDANPYAPGTEDNDSWLEGYEDAVRVFLTNQG